MVIFKCLNCFNIYIEAKEISYFMMDMNWISMGWILWGLFLTFLGIAYAVIIYTEYRRKRRVGRWR